MLKTLALLCALCFALALPAPAEAKSQTGVISNYASHISAKIKQNFNMPASWRAKAYQATVRIELAQAVRSERSQLLPHQAIATLMPLC